MPTPKITLRFQAQLPYRRSYKPARRVVVRVRPGVPALPAPRMSADCAPEGAWHLQSAG